ncbi:irregular chiasm C-roughest protein-like [Oppia nitens]|uniref:irregular chiasm C-roughest protein-like n=1 Tax=Oppia nitens TaxID=1686743 RepID=UPI0023DA2D23|nr:irregular chiasm C-roughest protein-like [Oppia nitens]
MKFNAFVAVFNQNYWTLIVWTLIFITFTTINSTQAKQHFSKRPEGTYTVLKDQTLVLPCEVRDLEGSCLWLHKSQGIGVINGSYEYNRNPDNGDCSLRIVKVDYKEDNGKWECQVLSINKIEKTLTSAANVVVLVAPSSPVINNLENNRLDVNADRQTQVECISERGNPSARLEWYINGDNVTQNSRTTVDSAASGTPKVTSVLNYNFRRSLRNSTITCLSIHETVSQNMSAPINVKYIPQVSVQQKKYTVNEGSSLQVRCDVDANPPTNVKWRSLGDQNLPFRDDHRTNSLIIERVTKRMNTAVFGCSAQNEFGTSTEENIVLDVLFEPTLVRATEGQVTAELNNTVDLFCEYEGNPKPKIYWYQINPLTDQVKNRPINGENANNLVIHNATYNDEGHYYCEAINYNDITHKEMVARSGRITVDITGRPEIVRRSNPTYGYRSTDTDIEQVFCSDPAPSEVVWLFGSLTFPVNLDNQRPADNGQDPKNPRFKVRKLAPMERIEWGKNTCYRSVFTVMNTDVNDEREYTLRVTNSRGTSESVIQLKVTSPVSAAIMITIGLIVLIMLLALTLVTLLVIKRRKLAKEKTDDESKAEARAPIKSDTDRPEKEPEKAKGGENHELVYANLEFGKSDNKQKTPPKVADKPKAQQRQYKAQTTNSPAAAAAANSGTEYAQITFANKADL